MTNTEVLIAGAGPTGLTLACVLARHGVDFRIVEKADAPFNGSRGKGLQPRSMEVFDDLGVIDRILANGKFHLTFRSYDGATVLGEHDMHEGRYPTPETPYASTLMIPQWRVEEILRARLAELGGVVEYGTELTDFVQDTVGGVTATVNGETWRARYLVGSDGGRSFVRKHLGVGFEGETWEDFKLILGDVRLTGLDRDFWHAWPSGDKGFLALCPLPNTDTYQLQALTGPEETEVPTLETFRELVRERTGRTDIVLHSAPWTSLYRANVRMVDRFRVDSVFLAGDAAHVHSPAGGQGMNTGIQDGYNLGWKLANVLRGAPDALLDSYETERLPIAAWLLGVTTRLTGALGGPADGATRRDPETLQLQLGYRDPADEGKEGLHVGDRMPDGPLPDGGRLFDLFRGPHFTLLGRESGSIRPDFVHAHVVPGASEDFVLVRPDGYVGAIGSLAEVEKYLESVLPLSDLAA
jgi:2-polyprenyl-6-methoxyphenol hydroxylase-like FAD-dependent oxidoreductase